MRKEEDIYRDKIRAILEQKLEYNGDHKKAIDEIKIWLCCEWQCDQIADMSEYTALLNIVDEIAEEIIKYL